MGAFYSTKNSGLTFRNFHMSNGTVFSTAPDRSRSIPARAHFTRQNAEGSWKSGYFKRRKPLHRNKFNTYRYSKFFLDIYLIDSNTIFAWWEQLANFSRGGVCKQTNRTHRNLQLPVHNFPENEILTFLWSKKFREMVRAVANHFASSVVSTRLTAIN